MSVTFMASESPLIGWDLVCVCGANFLPENATPLTYDDLGELLRDYRETPRALPGCEDDDCFTYGFHGQAVTEGPESTQLNMANGNAVRVMEALGIKTDENTFEDVCFGELDAEDFLGRVLIALAVAPVSAEIPTITDKREGGATFVHCGVDEGYVQDKLSLLRDVAEFAIEHNRQVIWS